ncbi:MAG: ATP-binding protein, partial [Prosthecobacter sp.]|nr:ATP-binding protein [Prosthecobacter sp.]
NAAQYAASETRRFAQVIAPDQATANALATKVRSGTSLAAAAQAAGLSASTTGDLTQSSYAATSTAAAAKAAFAAKQGDLIGPIQTGLGWSVARVENVTARPARSLADASADIRTELAKNKANEAIVDYYNAIQDAVNSGASIEEIAADRKLTLATTPALLPSGRRIFTGIIRDLTERKALEDKILHISEEEQARIGQDIHDDLCQQLAAIGCLVKVAQKNLIKSGCPEAAGLEEIVKLVSRANTRARETARGLMPVVIDSGGLMAALKELADNTARAYEIKCDFRYDNPVQVNDNKTSVQLFRIAQEAVSNAVKHSQARRVDVHLARQSGNIVLIVRDDGVGIPDKPAKGTGMGLLTMNHRAQMMGGTIHVSPRPMGGTQVTCSVPAPAKNP